MRAPTVTATDVALLRSLGTQRSMVAACREVGISRDRANYRVARLAAAFGGPVITSVRGGRDHGGSRLTPLGDRIARGGFDSIEMIRARPVASLPAVNQLSGVYRAGPPPTVEVHRGGRWQVSFPAVDGERLVVLLDPEAILVARGRFASSARNVHPARVASILRGRTANFAVVRTGGVRLRAAVTPEAVAQLGLRPGARVWLYVKATALRRAGSGLRAARPA